MKPGEAKSGDQVLVRFPGWWAGRVGVVVEIAPGVPMDELLVPVLFPGNESARWVQAIWLERVR